VHPELFELKALVAGRLDAHRRREIDDHLGSCADCSRHYVAMMIGSSSPKTAEAESREALVPTGAGSAVTRGGDGDSAVRLYGIDAPIAPSPAPRPAPARGLHNNLAALETEFPAPPARTQVAVSSSLVDAITKLRAESQAASVAPAAAPAPAQARTPVVDLVLPVAPSVAQPMVHAAAPVRMLTPASVEPQAVMPLMMLSVQTPTPGNEMSLRVPLVPPAADRVPPATELIVTFSSTPPRTPAMRSVSASSPTATAIVTPSQEYVSQAIPTLTSAAPSAFELSAPEPAVTNRKPVLLGGALAAAAVVVLVGLGGYKFFQSSVTQAASAAAAAATEEVKAAAEARPPAPVAVKVPAAPVPAAVETRIVYVERPSSRKGEPVQVKPETVTVTTSMPIAVTLPDVNLNTVSDASVQNNTQRNVTSELTRGARATASRTAAPRP